MHLLRITDYTKDDILAIFELAKKIEDGGCRNSLKNKTVILFFPDSSIRTRVTFEKGIHQLGGQSILFPSEALDKKEETKDVIEYLQQWADIIVVRHKSHSLIEEMSINSSIPIINAMSSNNHPCEILSDLYALSKLRKDYDTLNYTFIGPESNIGRSWVEAAKVLRLSLLQCCPIGYEMEGVRVEHDFAKAMEQSDVILTDSISQVKNDFLSYQVTKKSMQSAKHGALLNPCPPFTRGEEVSEDAIDSEYFVGYEFKRTLLQVQQAILLYHSKA